VQRELVRQSQVLKHGIENLFHMYFHPDDGLRLDKTAPRFNE
jgi:hypothetical protein